MKHDEYHRQFADRVIEQIRQGTALWQKPWGPGERVLPANVDTSRSYRGGNSLHLAAVQQERGYGDVRWGTYRQIQARGGQVFRNRGGLRLIESDPDMGGTLTPTFPSLRSLEPADATTSRRSTTPGHWVLTEQIKEPFTVTQLLAAVMTIRRASPDPDDLARRRRRDWESCVAFDQIPRPPRLHKLQDGEQNPEGEPADRHRQQAAVRGVPGPNYQTSSPICSRLSRSSSTSRSSWETSSWSGSSWVRSSTWGSKRRVSVHSRANRSLSQTPTCWRAASGTSST